MKLLPEHPNLSHLKQQAKDLLAQMRLEHPATSLSDAQTAVAEAYGYRTWPDLKAEVDRRRLKVEPAPTELAAAVADAFDLGTVTGPMLPVQHGTFSKDWSLETTSGRFMAVEVFDWVQEANIAAGIQLIEAAAAAGLDVPTPVRSPGGNVVEVVDGRKVRLFEWMDLGPQPIKPVAPAAAAEMGRVLGVLHGLALPTDAPIHPYLTYRPTEGHWRAAAARATATGMTWAPLLHEALPGLLELSTIAGDGGFPSDVMVCHSNLTPSSVRQGKDGGLTLLEWETAGPLSARWELGSVLMQWAAGLGEHWTASDPEDVHDAAIRALTDGYRSAGGDLDGLDVGMFTVAITGFLNWTIGRVNWATPHEGGGGIEQQRAEAELPALLTRRLSRQKLERMLEVMASSVGVRHAS